ncbi:DUF2238 domain-containing protein [Planctomicrobium sp. SH661]|uniref:DUF2238 domain-containing protein n=1 Tax=Planctomicrobium sp. SH661 TaxID=3448124 RepID=UPI003F5B3537
MNLRLSRQEWPVLLAASLYVLPALYFSWDNGNSEFIMYAAVLVVLGIFVLVLHRHVQLRTAALWGLWAWGLAHMAGGLVPIPASWPVNEGEPHVLYNWWIFRPYLKYDQLVHACGFGLTTWICWQSLSRAFINRGLKASPTFGLMVLCAAAGMGFGALNEVIEFLATRLMPETNVGGYENTGWDLVFNLIGSVIAVMLIRMLSSRRE